MQLMTETKSYFKYEYHDFIILIYKKLKTSFKFYSYQARTKLINMQNKNYTWYPVLICSIDELNEKYKDQTDDQTVKDNLELILNWHKKLIDSRIKDFRFPN